jgi:hypothetical protein
MGFCPDGISSAAPIDLRPAEKRPFELVALILRAGVSMAIVKKIRPNTTIDTSGQSRVRYVAALR